MLGPNAPYTKLDAAQIAKRVFDKDNDRIRVDGEVTLEGGEVEVVISDTNDSIKIGDGDGNYLDVNSDGSISVVPQEDPNKSVKNYYNEVNSVGSNTPTIVLTYTVPGATEASIEQVVFSGTNIATYELLVNNVIVDKKRTYFGGNLNDSFNFNKGYDLVSGDVVNIRVTHIRPDLGDFNARIQITEEV